MPNSSKKTSASHAGGTNRKTGRSSTSSRRRSTRTPQTSGSPSKGAGSSSRPKEFGSTLTGSSTSGSRPSILDSISDSFSPTAVRRQAKEQSRLMQTFVKGVVEGSLGD